MFRLCQWCPEIPEIENVTCRFHWTDQGVVAVKLGGWGAISRDPPSAMRTYAGASVSGCRAIELLRRTTEGQRGRRCSPREKLVDPHARLRTDQPSAELLWHSSVQLCAMMQTTESARRPASGTTGTEAAT